MTKRTLIISAGIFVLSTALYLAQDQLYWSGVKVYNELASKDRQVDIENVTTQSIEAENMRLSTLIEDGEYKLYGFAVLEEGMMVSGVRIRTFEANQILEQFNTYAREYDVFNDYPEYVMHVALIQWFSGNDEKTIELLSGIDADQLKDKYHLIQAGIDMTFGNFELAVASLNKVKDSEYIELTENMKKFLNEIYGVDVEYDYQKAKAFREDKNLFSKLYADIDDMTDMYTSNQNRVEAYKDPETNKSIYGKVMINGEPLRGAILYEKTQNGMSSYDGFERRNFVTDKDGLYKIDHVLSETKMIGIMIPWQLINDMQWTSSKKVNGFDLEDQEVNFEFSRGVQFKTLSLEGDKLLYEIEDPLHAENRYYTLKVHSVDKAYNYNIGYTDVRIRADSMKGELSIEELRSSTQFAFLYASSDDTLHVNRFMEPLYLSGDYYFECNPQIENSAYYSHNGLFSDSLKSVVYVPGQDTYNPGDTLISERKVEEAMVWYDENPTEHNLKVLFALYQKGYKAVDGEYYQTLEGAEPARALEYMEKLIEDYGEANYRLSSLARLYKEMYDFENEEGVRRQLVAREDVSAYDHIALAFCLMHQGKYEESVVMLKEKGNPSVEADRYYAEMLIGGHYEILPDHMQKEYLAIENLDVARPFHELIKSGAYIEAWNWLEGQSNEDIKTFYQLLMLDAIKLEDLNYELKIESVENNKHEDFIDYYVGTTELIQDTKARNVLEFIKEYHNWFSN